MIRITIACPEAHIGDANCLAMVLGEGANEANTFTQAAWKDESDNAYALASLPVSPEWLTRAQSPLDPDEQGGEMLEAAQRAQALIDLHMPVDEDGAAPPPASPARILVLAGDNPIALVQAAGLTRIEEPE